MTIDPAMLAAADAARGVFGEEVTYLRANGASVVTKALVDRSPRSADLGDIGAPRNTAEVYVRRTELPDVTEGQDKVRLRWVDGVERVAYVQVILKVSRGFWRLGVTL